MSTTPQEQNENSYLLRDITRSPTQSENAFGPFSDALRDTTDESNSPIDGIQQ
ncbi:hypothetical protein BGW36DRAFT_429909 [Talaromyces proteolyticus]|uniref:Uncharacterized protein n=1 Tax=Talaromyces proteolyticus TaxID=1131652 RepID=A0AAD4PYA8_9EURO|nr:uncharacterized protein BGW36DRAFT_429909 [Talaromyces proteolyticus]KAH8693881.1 hypothetical protein BGW36DRAFT_429909 [Talaromyces proteolyticus]